MSPDADDTIETPSQAARHATGIASERMYRVPLAWLEWLDTRRWSNAEARLLHVILHQTCRRTDDWYRGEAWQPETGYAASCLHLRRQLGIEASNGNRAIGAGLDGLLTTGIFESLAYKHRNRMLAWRFTDPVFEALFADEAYALLDVGALRSLPTFFELSFYGHLAGIRRMNAPRTTLSVEGLHALRGGVGEPGWGSVSKVFFSALRKILALHDMHAVVLLDWQGRLPGIDTISLRLRHAGTSWRFICSPTGGPMLMQRPFPTQRA